MDRDPEAFLPLRPVELQILVSLRGTERHGYGIVQAMEARGEPGVPGLVTLYRALQRMEARGLLERAEGEGPGVDADDDRRRTYRLTRLGSEVLTAEAVRLRALVRDALDGAAGGDAR
jgi:DNA-binding PadR family transcriptional regulator